VTDRQTDAEVLRSALAYIPQEPTLFRGTLRENLTLRTDADQDLIKLFDDLGLDGLLKRDGGLDQVVHERGANFSSGQKQLICLARAIIEDAPVIVMDEATSAIDPQTEKLLDHALTKILSNRTRVIVAHRLSTLAQCDLILWLDEGRVREFGLRQDVLPKFENDSM
jgi:ABC-type multidrug transport system fused ATPase/permease subunit